MTNFTGFIGVRIKSTIIKLEIKIARS